jgi:hypothetical protein
VPFAQELRWADDAYVPDGCAKVSSEVAEVAGDEVCALRLDGGSKDRAILLRQDDRQGYERHRALVHDLDALNQAMKARLLIGRFEVAGGLTDCVRTLRAPRRPATRVA